MNIIITVIANINSLAEAPQVHWKSPLEAWWGFLVLIGKEGPVPNIFVKIAHHLRALRVAHSQSKSSSEHYRSNLSYTRISPKASNKSSYS